MTFSSFLATAFGYAAGLSTVGGPVGAIAALNLKNHLSCKL